jgi:hypothetical protein
MTKDEFKAAVEMATSDRDLGGIDTTPLHGYGQGGFRAAGVTLEAVAALVRWQCCYLSGGLDAEELATIHRIFRRRVTVVGAEVAAS